jgi:hypothetical protein
VVPNGGVPNGVAHDGGVATGYTNLLLTMDARIEAR